jgi:probable rRNA maturation factor
VNLEADADIPSRSHLERFARLFLYELFGSASVDVLICGDRQIRKLNRQWRAVDAATDVLSFPAGEQDRDSIMHAGEIALSWDAVIRQAAANGNTPEHEAAALLAHGMLHLSGLDHDSDPAEQHMHSETLRLLGLAGISVRSYGH